MTQDGPQSPDQFVQHLRAFVDDGQYRDALAYAEQFSREFLPQLSDEELNRVTGMMEGADMIVDLEDWQASQSAGGDIVSAEGPPEQVVRAVHG